MREYRRVTLVRSTTPLPDGRLIHHHAHLIETTDGHPIGVAVFIFDPRDVEVTPW